MNEKLTWNNLKLASESNANQAKDFMIMTSSSNSSITIKLAVKFCRAAFMLGALWERNRQSKTIKLLKDIRK